MTGVDTTTVQVTVKDARGVASKTVFALVDVTIAVGGVEFGILGIQARRESDGQTSIRLPTFKDSDGRWQPAVSLPPEMVQPVGDAVLAFLLDEGLARRHAPASR